MDKKRLCLCVFYEKNGVLRNYVSFYLNALKEICEKVIVIANGKITQESKDKLKELDIDLIQRENKGLDFGAWKETLFKLGFENIKEYDELILTNTTCYGPLYPFSEIFNKMNEKKCDFWGITKHPEAEKDNIPKHIQS